MSEKQSGLVEATALPTMREQSEKMPSMATAEEVSTSSIDSKQKVSQIVRGLLMPERADKHLYITGLRGVLVVESFIWTFFQTFIPALVSNATAGPWYQTVLRDIFSVPLWNSSLIYNFFIILSMRAISVSFLRNPTGQTYAATMIRRIIRMVIILCVGSGISTAIFSQIGVGFIDEFKDKLPNRSIDTPMVTYDAVAAWNSLFNLFWLTSDFFTQAANNFWPTATLWAPSIMYYQGLGLFALGSFWMGSWGWYSATGLFLADIVINPTLRSGLKSGLQIYDDWRFPFWTVAALFGAIGVALKYAFVVLPQYTNSLLVLHPFLDLSQNYNPTTYAAMGPYPRLDDWFLIIGIVMAVEMFQPVQSALSFRPLVWLGDRSFSIFVSQCIIFWTGGIKLWLILHDNHGLSIAGANAVVFITCLFAIAAFAELFYRSIDLPSRWLARKTYTWLVD